MTLGEALQVNRWKQPVLEQTAGGFLKAKANSGTPVRQYMEFRIWNDYLMARQPANRKEARERFIWSMTALTAAFQQRPLSFDEETGKPRMLRLADIFYGSAPDSSALVSLWYPDMTKKQECACAYFSFYPLLIYYLNKLDDWARAFAGARSVDECFSQRAVTSSCAARNAAGSRHCRTSVSSTSAPETTATTCCARTNARTGATGSTERKKPGQFAGTS